MKSSLELRPVHHWSRRRIEGVMAIQIRIEEKESYARTAIEGISNQILRALGGKIPSIILEERAVVK